MTGVLLAPPPSWQGRLRSTVRKFDAADVEVLDTRRGRVLVDRAHQQSLTERELWRMLDEGRVDELAAGAKPYEVVTVDHNLLVNAGIQRALDLLFGLAVVQAYDSTHCRIGVGNDATAAANTQSDLQAAAGAANRQFQVMDATFPNRTSQTANLRSTFASGEANFVAGWQEWCIDPGTAAGTTITAPMLNRKVAALGTKVAGSVWQFAASLALA